METLVYVLLINETYKLYKLRKNNKTIYILNYTHKFIMLVSWINSDLKVI